MLKTFRLGGIHPAENKFSANKAIEELQIPEMVSIPISQHIGAPSEVVVTKGDKVKVGQLIAKSSGFISANIHSSVSGEVVKIDDSIDAGGFKKKSIFIKVEGDEWDDSIDKSTDLVKEIKATPEEIIKKTGDAGIVGLGGATFPAHVKMMVPKGKKAEVVIINAVECEPYLTSDHQLMLEKPEEILVGVEIAKKAVGVDKAIIGIENNKKDAIDLLTKLAANYPGTEICPLKVQYPQGGEKQLISACINREVPSGTLPIEVGAVIHNVGSVFAIYEAVQKNKPLFERVVTVTGKSVKNPCNLMVRVGTPITNLLEKAGGMPEDTRKIVGGGPMMGKTLTTAESPVTKGTSGILLMKDSEAKRGVEQNCIRCGKCTRVCAMGLEPYLLNALTKNNEFDRVEEEAVMDCIECGSCSYTCPANLPLLDYIRLGKSKVAANIRARQQK